MATWLNPTPNTYAYDAPVFGAGSDLSGLVSQVLSFMTSFTGVSMFATVLGAGQLGQTADSAGSKLIPVLVLGYLFNIVRRLVMWFLRRFRFREYPLPYILRRIQGLTEFEPCRILHHRPIHGR